MTSYEVAQRAQNASALGCGALELVSTRSRRVVGGTFVHGGAWLGRVERSRYDRDRPADVHSDLRSNARIADVTTAVKQPPRTTNTAHRHPLVALLIVAFVAVVGTDRIDLFSGTGPFALTPPVLLAPVLLVVAAVSALSGRGNASRWNKTGLILIYVLFTGLLVSAFASESDRTIARLAQLSIVASGAWGAVSLSRRLDLYSALKRGAIAGLVLFAFFDIVQWLTFQRYGLNPPSFAGVLSLKVTPYGQGVVRLAGGSSDANRAAITVATYAYILLGDPLSDRRRRVGADALVLLGCTTLVLATISRTGLVTFGVIMIGTLTTLIRRLNGAQRIGAALVAVVTVVAVWASGIASALGASEIADSRLNLSEGSAQSHFSLVARGLQDFSQSGFVAMILGRGYGSSYLYLEDFFPGNPYGNYHSLWITMLVEGGIVAFVVMAVLVIRPVASARGWLAVGVALAGVFYQSHTDATFWLQIAILWALGTATSTGGPGPTLGVRQGSRSVVEGLDPCALDVRSPAHLPVDKHNHDPSCPAGR